MGRILSICVSLLLFTNCKQSQKTISITDGVLIENVTIITPDRNGEITSRIGNIVIDGSTIVAITESKPTINGKFKSIDGTGKYTIPGLIDSHVHLNNIAGINFKQRQKHSSLVSEYFKRLPQNFLYYGYTTLVDVDNYAPKEIEQLRSAPIGPEIYTCGKKIQVMNDFEMVMNELTASEKLNQFFLHDKYNVNINYPDSVDLGKHTPEILVKHIASQGNICVKSLYEDASSGLPQVWELPSKEILKELVSEAHKQGMSVVMHAPSFEGHRFAVESGVDIIAHAMWNWTSDPEQFLSNDLPESHKRLLIEISKKGIGYQPTFRTILGEIDILANGFIEQNNLDVLYPDDYLHYLKSEDRQWARNRILNRPKYLSSVNPDFYNPIRNKFESEEQMFDTMYKSYKTKMEIVVGLIEEYNGNLLFGTDNGAMNMYTHPPGLNGYLEMQHWMDAGVSLKTLLRAATFNNAKAFNLLDTIGSIETGKKANILLLNSNPLESIRAYDDIDLIINKGRVLDRTKLAQK